ncbi:MAG: alpha/beta hydrolase family protein, partial [Bacteroidota bacterium]
IAAESGRYDVITSGDYNFGTRGIDISPDGNTLLFNRESINDSPELYMLPVVGGTPSKITGINDDLMEMIDRVKIEAKWITSTDGKKVHTWVIYPQDFDPSKKYPMITYCQGGPQQMVSQYFSTGWSFLTMAHQGYIIAAPNRRGCPGFGQDWVDAISRDYGGMPMQDILAVTDSMASLPFVDENRLAAIGASAGGYAVFWLAGNHEGRFSAFISHCGMFNMVSKYGSTEELWFPNWDNGGPYWLPEHEGYYREASPHSYANKWDTPIFIIAGEKDYRVPYTQSLEAFTVAQVKGIPSKLLVYPEENHWVLHPQEKVLWYREFFKFLDKYCKSK